MAQTKKESFCLKIKTVCSHCININVLKRKYKNHWNLDHDFLVKEIMLKLILWSFNRYSVSIQCISYEVYGCFFQARVFQ